MGKIITSASVSLDGYISGPEGSGFDHLFAWYGNGDTPVPTAQPDRTFRMCAASAAHWRQMLGGTGVLVVGRSLFDWTDGWGGTHPAGTPVVVLSHRPPPDWVIDGSPFTFVDAGIEEAVDWIDLVPVLLGAGVPVFPGLPVAPLDLDGPTAVIEGDGVTHLRYTVRGRSD